MVGIAGFGHLEVPLKKLFLIRFAGQMHVAPHPEAYSAGSAVEEAMLEPKEVETPYRHSVFLTS